jgi:uncharacterized membrane protein HdeD (DUF308 family)
MIVVGSFPNGDLKDSKTVFLGGRFFLQFTSVGLLALVPTIHALAEPLYAPSLLAAIFGRLLLINLFGCAFYISRPLERLGLVRFWQPSLHGIYLIVIYSLVEYSKVVI